MKTFKLSTQLCANVIQPIPSLHDFSICDKTKDYIQNVSQTIGKMFKQILLNLIYLHSPKIGVGLIRDTV